MSDSGGNRGNDDLYAAFLMGMTANSAADMIQRRAGRILKLLDLEITASNETVSIPFAKVNGTIEIFNQWSQIKNITTLNNCTDVHIDLWDGTVSDPVTKSPGATLSGAPVETVLLKTEPATSVLTVIQTDQGRVTETSGKKITQPFYLTQKGVLDTVMRANLTTTDTPLLFTVDIYIEWRPLDGGSLEAYVP